MAVWFTHLLAFAYFSVCVGEVPRGVCKEYINNECKCFPDVQFVGWSHNMEENRKRSVPCEGPCRTLPCCNGGSTEGCIKKENDACSRITFVSREEWGAKPPTHPLGLIKDAVPMFYIHHTATPACFNVSACSRSMRAMQQFHQHTRGWWDIAYSFLVGEDGRVYVGRGWGKVGSHTEGYNSVSYAASFIGNFMNKLPNELALNATKNLIKCGIQLGNVSVNYSLYGHRDACGDTDCPGNDLYKLIHSWKNYNRLPNPSAGCVSTGRRCKANVDTCKPGSLIKGSSLCLGANKLCCKLGKY